jgi:hypothetical protein
LFPRFQYNLIVWREFGAKSEIAEAPHKSKKKQRRKDKRRAKRGTSTQAPDLQPLQPQPQVESELEAQTLDTE